MKIRISISLEDDVVKILDDLARKEIRSRSGMVEYAVCKLLSEKGLLKEKVYGKASDSGK
jgi:metal-responsive CopG/Arc/MetJ family transcriptional regulator